MDKIIGLENEETKELASFLKNIHHALKKHSLKEINQTFTSTLLAKNERDAQQKNNIAILLDVVCRDFNVDRVALLNGRGKGRVQQARKFAFCILHNDFNISIRQIATQIFSLNWHTSVSIAIQYHKSLNPDLKADKEFLEKLASLKKKIYLKIENKSI